MRGGRIDLSVDENTEDLRIKHARTHFLSKAEHLIVIVTELRVGQPKNVWFDFEEGQESLLFRKRAQTGSESTQCVPALTD